MMCLVWFKNDLSGYLFSEIFYHNNFGYRNLRRRNVQLHRGLRLSVFFSLFFSVNIAAAGLQVFIWGCTLPDPKSVHLASVLFGVGKSSSYTSLNCGVVGLAAAWHNAGTLPPSLYPSAPPAVARGGEQCVKIRAEIPKKSLES